MNKNKKTLIQKAVIAPIVIGALTAVLFFLLLPAVSAFFPLEKQEMEIARFEQENQTADFVYDNVAADGTVNKNDILINESNRCFGSVSVNGIDIPLIYDADGVSLTNAVSVSADGSYIGEVGCAYAYGINSVLDINAFNIGQEVDVKTEYGKFVFTVIDITEVDSKQGIYSMNTKTKRGFVLYTNVDNGVGINSSFDAVVMEMKSGPAVAEQGGR